MIIYEFFVGLSKLIMYCILRFPIWIITARDCKHCKYSRFIRYTYDDEYECCLTIEDCCECKDTIMRKYFKRKVAQ